MADRPQPIHWYPATARAEVAPELTASELVCLFAHKLVPSVTLLDHVWMALMLVLGFVVVGLISACLLIFAEPLFKPMGHELVGLDQVGVAWPVIVLTIVAVISALRHIGFFVSKRIAQLAPWSLRGGISVPGRDIEVRKQPLATLLFAVALWSLREQGLVRVVPVKTSRSMPGRTREGLSVTILDRTPSSSLEARILLSKPLQQTTCVASIIGCIVAEESPDPWTDIVMAAAYDVSDQRRNKLQPATWAGAFHDVAERWQRFQISEPVLYNALLDESARYRDSETG